jgi:hypothetical protein
MIPTITIDLRQANQKMTVLPENVRSNLRRVLPDLAKRLGAKVEGNMDERLQSHVHLKVTKQLIENPTSISAKVALVWTGDAKKKLVPLWLEEGTKPHLIEARNAPVLAFFWPKINAWFFGKRVNHPGNKPYRIFEDAVVAMTPEIRATIRAAVISGSKPGGA